MSYNSGKLTILRSMVDEHVRREGSLSSFMVRSGLLLELIDELARLRENTTTEAQP